jgi:hypothetical protein
MSLGGSSNRGPSTAELQKFIRDKITVVLLLANGDKVVGQLRWVDETAFQIQPDGQVPFTVLRSAVLGWQRKDAEGGVPAPAAKQAVATGEKPAAAASEAAASTAATATTTTATTAAEPAAEVRADDIGGN